MEKKVRRVAAQTISGFLLSFVLSIVLLLATLLAVARIGAFGQPSFESLVTEEYCSSVFTAFVEHAKDYTLPTGITPSVIDGTFTLEGARRDVLGYISEAFSKSKYKPDISAEEAKLRENVRADLESSGSEGDIDKITEQYVKEIDEIYRDKMRLPGVDLIIKVRTKAVKYAPFAFAGVGALALVLVLIIVFSHRSDRAWARYLAYVCGAVCLMTAAAPAVLRITAAYERLNLAPEYFYRFVMSFIRQLLDLMLIAAAVWLVLMVLFIIIDALVNRKKRGAEA